MKKTDSYILLIFIATTLVSCNLYEPYNELPASGDKLVETNQNSDDGGLKSAGKSTISIKGNFVVSSDKRPGTGCQLFLRITGVGNASHMGRTSLSMDKVVITTACSESPPYWDASAEITITAACGDIIYCNYDHCTVDLSLTPNFAFQTKCIVSGGTGRFKKASGILNYYEVFCWSEAIGSLKIKGEITL